MTTLGEKLSHSDVDEMVTMTGIGKNGKVKYKGMFQFNKSNWDRGVIYAIVVIGRFEKFKLSRKLCTIFRTRIELQLKMIRLLNNFLMFVLGFVLKKFRIKQLLKTVLKVLCILIPVRFVKHNFGGFFSFSEFVKLLTKE